MNSTRTPATLSELAEAVRSAPRVIAVGGGTKPRLSAVDAVRISTARLSGLVEYEPDEFTFTALAGTPVREIASILAARGQYLPFDPLWVEAGATLGGTVASGVSGPGRFRFGGLRDFILGVRFVDGAGRLLRLGGKVVKNAAGFDVPKFLVGSLGRFGVLGEITCKVFPQPAARLTLALEAPDPEGAAQILIGAANSRWELEALDALPEGKTLALRLGGPAAALPMLAQEILSRWPGRVLAAEESDALWRELREVHWAEGSAALVKVALAPGAAAALARRVGEWSGARLHLSAGGNVAFVALGAPEQAVALDDHLRAQGLSAVTLRGNAPLWLGVRTHFTLTQAVKAALDANHRFPGLDD